MPCESGPSYEDIQKEREYLDIAERLACEYCRHLEKAKAPIPGYARRWWKDHQKADRKREAEQKEERELDDVRRRAISKLSEKERIALGLRRNERIR